MAYIEVKRIEWLLEFELRAKLQDTWVADRLRDGAELPLRHVGVGAGKMWGVADVEGFEAEL